MRVGSSAAKGYLVNGKMFMPGGTMAAISPMQLLMRESIKFTSHGWMSDREVAFVIIELTNDFGWRTHHSSNEHSKLLTVGIKSSRSICAI